MADAVAAATAVVAAVRIDVVENGLIALAQAGDRESQAKLLAGLHAMLMSEACRCARPGVDVDDLLAEGHLAALAAIQSYEPGHGTALSTWAWRRVRQAVERAARRELRAIRASADDEMMMTVEAACGSEPVARDEADSLLDGLDATDVLILRLRHEEGLTVREAAERVGLSRAAVSRRELGALAAIRRRAGIAGISETKTALDGITGQEGEEPSTAPGGLARGNETPDVGEEMMTMIEDESTQATETQATETQATATATESPVATATESPVATMQVEGVVIGGTPGAAAATETGATPPATEAGTETGTGAAGTGEATPPSGEESTKRPPRYTASEKLSHLTTIDGWVTILNERIGAAVEAATKDDPKFEPPVKVEEVVSSIREGLSLILPEITPKLTPLATACAGARQARIDRETKARVEKMRQKAASKKAADRDAAQREVEALRAKLAALEVALKGESSKTGG